MAKTKARKTKMKTKAIQPIRTESVRWRMTPAYKAWLEAAAGQRRMTVAAYLDYAVTTTATRDKLPNPAPNR